MRKSVIRNFGETEVCKLLWDRDRDRARQRREPVRMPQQIKEFLDKARCETLGYCNFLISPQDKKKAHKPRALKFASKMDGYPVTTRGAFYGNGRAAKRIGGCDLEKLNRARIFCFCFRNFGELLKKFGIYNPKNKQLEADPRAVLDAEVCFEEIGIQNRRMVRDPMAQIRNTRTKTETHDLYENYLEKDARADETFEDAWRPHASSCLKVKTVGIQAMIIAARRSASSHKKSSLNKTSL